MEKDTLVIKDHMNVDTRTKLITKFSVSSASPCDSIELENLIDETGNQVHVDSAYRSENREVSQREKLPKLCT